MDTQTIITELKSTMQADAKVISDRLKWVEGSIVELAQKGENHGGGMMRATKSLGDQAAELFTENSDVFNKSGRLRIELKAASDAVTTAAGRNLVMGGVGAPSTLTLGIQNGLSGRDLIGASAIEYSRFLGVEGAAGVQASEGATKPSVRPTHSLIQQSAITIAAITTISRQALSDSVELKKAVETTLLRACGQTLDATLYGGSVSPVWAGLADLATTLNSDYGNLADSVSDAMATMQENGFMPNAVFMSPKTWVSVMTERADAGAGLYLSGSYLQATEATLRGLPVYLSNSVALGSAMVADTSHIELISVQAPVLEIGTINDQFSRNLASLLYEFRVCPIFRTVGAAILVSPAIV